MDIPLTQNNLIVSSGTKSTGRQIYKALPGRFCRLAPLLNKLFCHNSYTPWQFLGKRRTHSRYVPRQKQMLADLVASDRIVLCVEFLGKLEDHHH